MNFTRDMLLARAYTLMPPESVVVELLEDVEPDDEVEAVCEELVGSGYALALDDFVWGSGYGRLLELATIVKVDVLDQPASRLDEIAQRLAPYDVRLLAERIETAEVRAMCAGLGYELFQGYFYARPEMVKKPSAHERRDRDRAGDERAARHAHDRLAGGSRVQRRREPELQAAAHGELRGARWARHRIDPTCGAAQRTDGAEQMARAAARLIDRSAWQHQP